MLPIGITCLSEENQGCITLGIDYIKSIERAGGIPVPIAVTTKKSLPAIIKIIRGLLLSGGDDVDPSYFSEEPLPGQGEITPLRDRVEIALTKMALAQKIPVLGICRGAQVLNIAAGGSIYQDLRYKKGKLLEHMQKAPRAHPFHNISVFEETTLYKVLGGRKIIRVNSFHHQAIKKLGTGFRVSAVSLDGVIEGIESTKHPFAMGVQWHPEALARKKIPGGRDIFAAFVQAAQL
ncbi:MAG: type 1 glutamine amidotransferase [Firmicutes bacterium]|nr:type 1 glutamine amidotransferase [Bacillota bacterium]